MLIMKKLIGGAKLFTVLLFLIFWQPAGAQKSLVSQKEFNDFLASRTMVVLESGVFSVFNNEIKAVMEEHWTITPYDYIDNDQFREMMSDSTLSFLVLTRSFFDRDRKSIHYDFLNLMQGKKHTSLSELPELASVPLDYSGGEEEYYGFKLRVILRFIHERGLEMKREGVDPAMKSLTYYNRSSSEVKEGKLIMYSGDLQASVASEKGVAKYYDSPVKIVSAEEMADLVSHPVDGVYFLHVVGPEEGQRSGLSFKMIFRLNDAAMVYYRKSRISDKKPAGFGPADLKRLK